MPEIKIVAAPNGPYLIEGPIQLVDGSGAVVDTSNRPKVALCRCGASNRKPFCDGAHARIGFKDPEAQS